MVSDKDEESLIVDRRHFYIIFSAPVCDPIKWYLPYVDYVTAERLYLARLTKLTIGTS